MTTRTLKILAGCLAGVALIGLSGCASSMVPKDTRDADSGITSMVQSALRASDLVTAQKVEVQTREAVVYLTGVVDEDEARREAGRIAWRTDGVEGVINSLTVGARTAGSKVDDALISSKVKSKLYANREIRARDIDVSASQGVVTLIGRVSTEAIKADAERIARETKGVDGVNNELRVGSLSR